MLVKRRGGGFGLQMDPSYIYQSANFQSALWSPPPLILHTVVDASATGIAGYFFAIFPFTCSNFYPIYSFIQMDSYGDKLSLLFFCEVGT